MFEKIKGFLSKIFKKQKLLEEKNIILDNDINIKSNNIKSFKEDLSSDNKIYNIQKLYESGEILEEDLTISQIKELISLYKQQISVFNNK